MELPNDWHDLLQDEFSLPYMKALSEFLSQENRDGHEIYPPMNQVFNAFSYTSYKQVRLVIIGQDPYHGEGQAHGLSFSVPKGIRLPPSLKNIFSELSSDLQIPRPQHGSLISWAEQGVLLLNSTLTVRAHMPGSHRGKGWELFTDAVVHKLALSPEPILFLLWGKAAQEKGQHIPSDRHAVLTAPHPSPYSASSGFFGCRHFSSANEILTRWGYAPIDWRLSQTS